MPIGTGRVLATASYSHSVSATGPSSRAWSKSSLTSPQVVACH
jgi:hypothetical protein